MNIITFISRVTLEFHVILGCLRSAFSSINIFLHNKRTLLLVIRLEIRFLELVGLLVIFLISIVVLTAVGLHSLIVTWVLISRVLLLVLRVIYDYGQRDLRIFLLRAAFTFIVLGLIVRFAFATGLVMLLGGGDIFAWGCRTRFENLFHLRFNNTVLVLDTFRRRQYFNLTDLVGGAFLYHNLSYRRRLLISVRLIIKRQAWVWKPIGGIHAITMGKKRLLLLGVLGGRWDCSSERFRSLTSGLGRFRSVLFLAAINLDLVDRL